jgi:hypothetical protein
MGAAGAQRLHQASLADQCVDYQHEGHEDEEDLEGPASRDG